MTQPAPDAFAERLQASPDAGLMLLAASAASLRDDDALPGEALGAGFLEAEPPQMLDEAAADRALARIDALSNTDKTFESQARRAAGAAARRLAEIAQLPDPVREAALSAVLAGRGWGFAGPGIRRLALDVDGPGQTELLRIEPGAGVASHDHEDEEYTLVLTGAFHDGHALYQPGDISVGVPGFKHEPKALPGEVCFALAVSYGSPAFDGPMGLLQRLTGFGR